MAEFKTTEIYRVLYALGDLFGVYSGIFYFVLAVLALFVFLRVSKVVVKVALTAAVIYCCSGVIFEYLPYLENILKIF